MSIASTLALMVAAGVRAKPDPRDHEIIGLKVDLADTRRVEAMWRERAESSERDLAQARLERDLWRERAVSQVLNYRPQQVFFCNCVPSRAQVWGVGRCGGGGGSGSALDGA